MKKLLLVSLCFLWLGIAQVFAQSRTITGTVIAKEDGGPIPGASVKVKGTSLGVITGADGKYSIKVPVDSKVLVFGFIGYATIEKPITGSVVNVTLEIAAKELGEVQVTTALGIKHQAKELGYAATNIGSKQLTETHPTNFTNGLTAKAPGLVISTLDNGIDPQTRFTLRGNRHLVGNNYALVLLNGVPISPNDVNSINPDDIESVDVLAGAGAAALYGSEASNGAISITTKHGSPNGTPQVVYSNTFLAEKISYFPSLQTDFGSFGGEFQAPYYDAVTNQIVQPVPYENQSYGPRYDGHLQQLGLPANSANGPVQMVPYSTPSVDPRLAFFQTGFQDQNNISYAQGDAANSFNLSVNNLARKGVVPNDRTDRTTIRFSAAKTYSIFKADFTMSYARQNTSTYGAGYDGSSLNGGRSLLSGLLNSPSWAPLQNYKDINAVFSDVNTFYNSYDVNPYWVVANSRFNTQTDNFNGSFSATLSPTKWFNLQYRIAGNYGIGQQQYTRAQVNFSAYYHSDPLGTQNEAYGALGGAANTPGSIPGQVQNITQYGDGSIATGAGPQGYSRLTQDVFANFNKTFFNDFKTTLLIGSSIWGEDYKQISNSSTQLLVNGFYNIGSILGVPTTGQNIGSIRQIAFLGDLTIGYKDFAFLEVTDRNDHDSRLSAANRSFFYPSVKGSLLLTDAIPALKNNRILSYAKLRASLSKVGDVNVSPYSINNTFAVTGGFPYGNTGGLSLSTNLNNPTLKPEFTQELEIGTDLAFFDNRINGSFTWYKTNTTNQTLPVTTAPETGYTSATINIGETQNTGIEAKLDVQVLTKQKNGVGLDLAGNFSLYNSKVVSLADGQSALTLTTISSAAAIQAVVGQSYPTLMATDLVRDPQGHVVVDANTGNPTLNPTLTYMGQGNAKYVIGLTQTVSYKFVTLSVTSEFRTGNVIYNQGLLQATAAGTSQLSASSGHQQFVFPNSVIQTSPGVYIPNTTTLTSDGGINFFDSGAFYSAGSTYVVSGAFWKVREADLNFDVSPWVKRSKFIKRASISLIGRNLLMFRPKSNTWTDPEFSSTSGNSVGYETNQLPPTRIFGANLSLTF